MRSIPRPYHVRTARLMLSLETIVGGYMRGQALTSGLIGGFTYVLLLILHVPNALILAILAGFTDLIPYIGPVLATAAPVLFALSQGVPMALIVLVALVLYEELESRLIIPRVYGKTLRLSPVAVTIALLLGGKLFGIVGALIALPIAAAIRATVEELRIDLPGEQTGRAGGAGARRRRPRRAISNRPKAPPPSMPQTSRRLSPTNSKKNAKKRSARPKSPSSSSAPDRASPPTPLHRP